jgi:glycosyltransferase involved in cell wall biosynthesis
MLNKNIIFYAAHLKVDPNSAGAVRCDMFINKLNEKSVPLQVWTHHLRTSNVVMLNKTSERLYLWSQLATNKERFFVRFIRETVAGVELGMRILFQLKNKKSHIILSSPPYITCLIAAFACRFVKQSYSLDIRDIYPEVYFHQNLIKEKSLLGRLQKYLAAQFYRGSKYIFTVTESLKEIIITYTGSSRNIYVIRNGFDIEVFNSKPVSNGLDPFVCVIHGNLGHMQDIDLVIRVARRIEKLCPQVIFKIAGKGPMQDKLVQSDVPKNIQFLGEMSYDLIPQFLANSHLGLSFRKEGVIGETAFPVKIFEYIGVGIPILLTPIGEAGQIIQQSGIGFQFSNCDDDKIVFKIIELVENKEIYQNMLENIKTSRTNFSRQAAADAFVTIVEDNIINSR